MKLILADTCSQFVLNEYNVTLNNLFASKAETNSSITNLLGILLKNSEKSLDLVEHLLKQIMDDKFVDDRRNADVSNTLKLHFLSFYKVLIEFTANVVKSFDKNELARVSSDPSLLNESLERIKRIVHAHCELVKLKKHSTFKDVNYLTVIKNSKLFLNNFLKYGMPYLDQAFEQNKNDVVEILMQLQDSFSFLKEVCLKKSYSALSKQTPVYMRCLEAFALRVKELLYVNNYDEAFTVKMFEAVPVEIASNGRKKIATVKSKKVNPVKQESDDNQNSQSGEEDEQDNEDE